MRPVSLAEVERMFATAGERFLLLLLTESRDDVPKVKSGLPALAYRVMDSMTAERGPLDEALVAFAKQRPSRVIYRRLYLDRKDSAVMTRIGCCWLPQVRVSRRGKTLFRSSVSMGDNGEFLAQDVGGKSFVRRSSSSDLFPSLLEALAAEVDRGVSAQRTTII